MHGQVPKAAKGLVVISDLDEIVKCYARRCHAICRQHIVNIVNILFIPPIHSTIHPSIHSSIHSLFWCPGILLQGTPSSFTKPFPGSLLFLVRHSPATATTKQRGSYPVWCVNPSINSRTLATSFLPPVNPVNFIYNTPLSPTSFLFTRHDILSSIWYSIGSFCLCTEV